MTLTLLVAWQKWQPSADDKWRCQQRWIVKEGAHFEPFISALILSLFLLSTRPVMRERLSLTTAHQLTMSLNSKPHTYGAYVFRCNLPLAPLAEWPGSFTCYCGKTGVERIPKWESAQKAEPGEKKSPAASAGTRTRDPSITSPVLYCWAIPTLKGNFDVSVVKSVKHWKTRPIKTWR